MLQTMLTSRVRVERNNKFAAIFIHSPDPARFTPAYALEMTSSASLAAA